MFKTILTILLLISISGCNADFFSFREIKWATIDNSKLRQIVGDRFKVENPYPDAINKEDAHRERSRLGQQISDITSIGTAKCREIAARGDNGAPTEASPYRRDGDPIPTLGPAQIYKLLSNSKYQNCMRELENDQLVADLKNKLSAIEEMSVARQKHDRLVMEKAEKYINAAISEYAESNHFDLVIFKQSDDIAYNKSKVTLDITEAVLNSMPE